MIIFDHFTCYMIDFFTDNTISVPLLGLFRGAMRPAFVPLRPALYNNALP